MRLTMKQMETNMEIIRAIVITNEDKYVNHLFDVYSTSDMSDKDLYSMEDKIEYLKMIERTTGAVGYSFISLNIDRKIPSLENSITEDRVVQYDWWKTRYYGDHHLKIYLPKSDLTSVQSVDFKSIINKCVIEDINKVIPNFCNFEYSQLD